MTSQPIRDMLITELRYERAKQESLFEPEHDILKTPRDWHDDIVAYATMALQHARRYGANSPQWRHRMRQVAALAMAACEAYDLRKPEPHPMIEIRGTVANQDEFWFEGERIRLAKEELKAIAEHAPDAPVFFEGSGVQIGHIVHANVRNNGVFAMAHVYRWVDIRNMALQVVYPAAVPSGLEFTLTELPLMPGTRRVERV